MNGYSDVEGRGSYCHPCRLFASRRRFGRQEWVAVFSRSTGFGGFMGWSVIYLAAGALERGATPASSSPPDAPHPVLVTK